MMGTRRNQRRDNGKERRRFESRSPGWPRDARRSPPRRDARLSPPSRDARPSRRRDARGSHPSRDGRPSPPSRDARRRSRRDARPSRPHRRDARRSPSSRDARPSPPRRDARFRSSRRRFARLSLSSFSCLSFFVSSSSLFCSLLFRPFLNYFLFSNIF